jgi:hypothetical protein
MGANGRRSTLGKVFLVDFDGGGNGSSKEVRYWIKLRFYLWGINMKMIELHCGL